MLPTTAPHLLWAGFVVVALLLLDVVGLRLYGVLIPAAALVVGVLPAARPRRAPLWQAALDRMDAAVLVVFYLAVVALFRLAFAVFTAQRVTGLFLAFAAGLLVGVVGPVIYTVWIRRRPLASLGLSGHRWREALGLGVVFAAVQYAITLWRYSLPQPMDWVPLLVMSLTVGFFEAVFFRGFVQGRLEESFGVAPGVFGAAALYALYHVGYGMGGAEMVFLFGLGVVYAVAYRLVQNILVLWPLLTPLGSFFNQLSAGELAGQLPWMSILGFADVLVIMGVVLWFARRTERRRTQHPASPPQT